MEENKVDNFNPSVEEPTAPVPTGETLAPAKDATPVHPKKRINKRVATSYLTKIAILAALSSVLYLFARFPIFPPPFNVLDMDFSDIPALLGGFALGPVAGEVIILIKCIIKLSTSSTAFVGELSNFIVSSAFVLPACLIYKYNKSKKGALLGLGVGAVCCVVISMISNYFIILPFFASAFHAPIYMERQIRTLFAFGYGVAFNLIKTVVASVITFLLYKRLSRLLHI